MPMTEFVGAFVADKREIPAVSERGKLTENRIGVEEAKNLPPVFLYCSSESSFMVA